MSDAVKETVRDKVVAILAEQAVLEPARRAPGRDARAISASTRLGLVETIFAIEEAFDIQVPFNANEPEAVRVRHQHRRHHGAGRGEPDRGPEVAWPRRVVITGQGAVNALGRTAGETMAAMREGRSGIGAAGLPGRRAAVDRRSAGRSAATARGALRPAGADALRPLHPVRAPRRPRGDGAVRPRDRRGAGRAGRGGARHLGRRPADPGRELPAGLPGGEEPGASLRGAAADEQRRRQPRLDGAGTCRGRATPSPPPAPRRTTRWARR